MVIITLMNPGQAPESDQKLKKNINEDQYHDYKYIIGAIYNIISSNR